MLRKKYIFAIYVQLPRMAYHITSELSIGFDNGAKEDLQGIAQEQYKKEASNDYIHVDDVIDIEDEDIAIGRGADRVDVITKSIESIEEVWHKCLIKTEMKLEQVDETDDNDQVDKAKGTGVEDKDKAQGYVTHYGCVSHLPQCLIETAYGMIHEMHLQIFYDASEPESLQMIDLFYKSLENRPEESMRSLHEEVIKP